VPGFKQKIVESCRRFGKFRPRFISIDHPASLAEGLAIPANEGAISMHPTFVSHLGIPNLVMVPIADKQATWDLFIVWQRGKSAGPLRVLLEAVRLKPDARSVSANAKFGTTGAIAVRLIIATFSTEVRLAFPTIDANAISGESRACVDDFYMPE
jgi:hypothetical protein